MTRDLGDVASHFDVALVSEHDDNDALVAYQAHPLHVAGPEYVNSVIDKRAVRLRALKQA